MRKCIRVLFIYFRLRCTMRGGDFDFLLSRFLYFKLCFQEHRGRGALGETADFPHTQWED